MSEAGHQLETAGPATNVGTAQVVLPDDGEPGLDATEVIASTVPTGPVTAQ
jgi:hypothetical protein